MTIKRNRSGQQNLNDLRRELAKRDDVTVYTEGGNWVISRLQAEFHYWLVSPCPYWYTERQAIQHALYGQPETKDQEAYIRRKASE